MNVLLETYIFYVDIYFVQNFFAKIVVLYVSMVFMKQYPMLSHVKGIFRLMGIAALGTICEVIGLLIIRPYWIYVLLIYVFVFPGMIQLLLSKRERKSIGIVVRSVFFTIVLNGIVQCLWNYLENKGTYIGCVLFAGIAMMVIAPIWDRYKHNQKGIYLVKLVHDGKEILVRGYYDSGNCLKDPYSHKGVQIVSQELAKKLTTKENYVYIPYQSLGNENGIITVMYIDFVHIFTEKEKVLEKVPIGIAEDNLFQGKTYKMILNEGVL